jgi:Skp family chaperone for outer membrane proteins
MHKVWTAAGLALAMGTTAGSAQDAPAPVAATCFIEVQKLMGEPPEGVGDLGAAIRRLDETLRPQVEEISRLRAELERIEQRQARAMRDDEDETIDLVAVQDQERKIAADLDARQAQLKLDYAAQQQAIVGPVQTLVSQRAQAFAAERGCSEIKMARTPDLADLQAAGAQNVTGDFVGWYVASKS